MKKLLLKCLLGLNVLSILSNGMPYKVFPHVLFFAPEVVNIHTYLNTNHILAQYCKKIEHEPMLHFFQQECRQVLEKEIHFYVGSPLSFGAAEGCLAFAVGDDSIVFEPAHYAILENLFIKNINDWTEQDKGTADIVRFILQHETGHLKNKDAQTRQRTSLIFTALRMTLFEASRWAFQSTYASIGMFFVLNSLHSFGIGIMSKQQEYYADDCVTKSDAVAGGKQFFKNIMSYAKNNTDFAWRMKINLTHPTPEGRLKRLESRMQD